MEYWDAYDRHGRKTGGTLMRGAPVPEGSYHLVSCIVVRHTDGDFLLLRRAACKEAHPNILEIGVAGCALQGEDAVSCARRELREETGITCDTLTKTGRYVDDSSKTIYEGYECVTNIPKDQIRLQPEENSAYYWYTPEEFLTFFRSDQCLDRFKRRLKDYIKTIG
ncbi:MAG: NUDIX domain-containing protein [Oscillospiraceae bacterium]|nr:NUDIX domain-containing protein [Oscillospiraceae bacterium]